MKKPSLRATALAVSTCPEMDNHGFVQVSFWYRDAEPLVFTVSLVVTSRTNPEPERLTVELDRAAVYGLLTDGVFGEILVLGETSVKVRESARHLTCIRLPLPERDRDTGVFNPMFMVSTESLKNFIEETYRIVPLESENACVRDGIERFLAEVLG